MLGGGSGVVGAGVVGTGVVVDVDVEVVVGLVVGVVGLVVVVFGLVVVAFVAGGVTLGSSVKSFVVCSCLFEAIGLDSVSTGRIG